VACSGVNFTFLPILGILLKCLPLLFDEQVHGICSSVSPKVGIVGGKEGVYTQSSVSYMVYCVLIDSIRSYCACE